MKNSFLVELLSSPLVQLISFCIIVFTGASFGAPYVWYVIFGLTDKQLFAFVGVVALVLVAVSALTSRWRLQLWGLVCMWLSLILFWIQTNPATRIYLIDGIVPVLLVSLFVAISVLVFIKHLTEWKNS